MRKVRVGASILSCDFSYLEKEIKRVERAGVDLIHFDIMDGHFVPNLTFGSLVLKALRKKTKLPFDAHLMVEEPEMYIEEFKEAGADIITIHYEATRHLHRTVKQIKKAGIKASVSLNPPTPVYLIEPVLKELDMVLLMSVNPGFAGQKFKACVLPKIKKLKELIVEKNLKIDIQVDGGINEEISKKVISAGADILIAASAIFNKSGDLKKIIRSLRRG